MGDMGGDMPIIPFGPEQWKRFYKAKDTGGEWMGFVYQKGKWVRADVVETGHSGHSEGSGEG